jgi:hypothetical protein
MTLISAYRSLFERIRFGASRGCDQSRESRLTSFSYQQNFKSPTHRTAIWRE